MNFEATIKGHLSRQHMMQLATVSGNQPWCCTVYFVFDEDLNLYWASYPTRRHSKEIEENPKVAAAIAVKCIKGEKVIGVQVEGDAKMLAFPEEIEPIAKMYAKRFSFLGPNWIEKFSRLETEHRMYKLTPRKYVVFDEENNPPDQARQEWIPRL